MALRPWMAMLALAAVLGAASVASADEGRWIIAPADTPAARSIAQASGAHEVDRTLGIWTAPAPTAHRLAARLRARGLLRFSEPDQRVRLTSPAPAAREQDVASASWWRPRVLGTAGETPLGPAGPAALPIAVIEPGGFDATHPEIPPSVTLRRPAGIPDNSHGTAVVSVIAGRGPRVFGVSPGSDVRVYGFDFTCSDGAAAIHQAVSDGARVISMSYGFAGRSACLAHEVATSFASNSAVVIASAGNFRSQPWVQPGNDFHVLTIGALNAFNQPTGFTHQSVQTDLSAPGEGIGVACPVAVDTDDGVPDAFCEWDGTSFSAPMVAAVAARVWAARPSLSPYQVSGLLTRSATDIGGRKGFDISTGYGLVNLAGALTVPAPPHDYGEPNDDIEWVDGRIFRPDTPLLRGRAKATVVATADALKDPVDVYPVWIGPHEDLQMKVRTRTAPVRIAISYPGAKSIFTRADRVTTWLLVKPGPGGWVSVSNSGAKGRKVWASVYLRRGRELFTSYVATFRRR